MNCKDPSKHRLAPSPAPMRHAGGDGYFLECGCVVQYPLINPRVVKSTSPVTASPNEDRFPR